MRIFGAILLLLLSSRLFSQGLNLDFENLDFTGWTGNYTTNNCTSPTPNVRNTVGINFTSVNSTTDNHAILTNSANYIVIAGDTIYDVCPNGGMASARIGNTMSDCSAADLSQSFLVSLPDTSLTLYYAAILSLGHPPQDDGSFSYKLKDAGGAIIDSLYLDGSMVINSHRNWTARPISLSAYVGQVITIEFITSDCNGGSHLSYALVDMVTSGGTTGAIKNIQETSFNVFPNPANNFLQIEFSLPSAEFALCDVLGKTIKTLSSKTGKANFDLSDLQNGVYFITMKDAHGKELGSKKVVVKH